MGLAIEAAIARTAKYASRDSGDSAELVERPGGGLSIVVVDGQGSGQPARALGLLVSSHAIGLIKDGVRDGVVARAAHDRLFAFRHGQVSATLDLVSVDLRTKTLLVTRNAQTPLLVGREAGFEIAPCSGEPLGLYLRTKPAIWELPIEAGLRIVVCTDGVVDAGGRSGLGTFDILSFVQSRLHSNASAIALADSVLDEAVRRDAHRPGDDMTVVAVVIRTHDETLLIRRQATTVPLP